MSQENVEIVRSVYEAFNRRDWDAAFRDQHPNVELTTPPRGLRAGTYRGREECRGDLEGWIEAFEGLTIEPEEFEDGDQVVVFVKARARPKGGGAEIEIRNGHLWAIHEGKAVSLRMFPEPEKALEAAGLGE